MHRDLLDYWFSEDVKKFWFNSTPAFDQQLRESYADLWQQAANGELDFWCESAEGCLALVILLDQFPLNMFRGTAESFSTEQQSRDIARLAIEKNFDSQLSPEQKAFLYMPFMHSENLEDQTEALRLFDQPGLEDNFRFARHHYGIVEKFGRFPHRNKVLGRQSSEAEIAYLNSKEAFKG